MSDIKHILIIPSWYPLSAGDVSGSFFREQAIALHKAGHRVGVIKPTFRSIKDIQGVFCKPYGLQVEDDLGVKTYRYHALNWTPRLQSFSRRHWIHLGEKLYLEYTRKHGKPDVLHVHSLLPGGFLAARLKRKYKIPFVVTEHSSAYARNLISTETLGKIKQILNDSSFRLAVSDEFKKLLTKTLPNSSWEYIPNIVNNDFLTTQIVGNSTNIKNFCFVSISYLTKNKRVDLLIRSFVKAFRGDSSVKLKIGGDGEEKASLLKLVEDLGVCDQVTFLGQLSRDEVKEQILSSDAFVLSSEYETFGVVLVEALALGKPIIATKCGGPESIVAPKVGYLVDKNSEDSLSNAMQALIENRNNFNPETIRCYCQENFSEAAVVAKLNEVYDSVLALSEE